jgi:hypothetical protein
MVYHGLSLKIIIPKWMVYHGLSLKIIENPPRKWWFHMISGYHDVPGIQKRSRNPPKDGATKPETTYGTPYPFW